MNKLNNEKLVALVEYKLKDTLCNLMYDILESPVKDVFNPPDMLNKFEAEIRQLYTQLYDCLTDDIKNRQDFRKKLQALEDKITDKAVFLNKYICVNNLLGEKIIRNIKLDEVSKVDTDISVNSDNMADVIMHFFSHLDNDMEAMYKKAEIMAALPLRMTSAKYRDYIKAGFGTMAKELPDEFVSSSADRLKDMCAADNKGMEDDFPLMKQSTDEIQKLSSSDFDRTSAEENLNIIDDNIRLLQDTYACLGVLYNDVTYLKILTDFVPDSEFMFDEDFVLKDLYYSVCNTITENDDLLADTIKENLDNEIEARFEKSKALEAEISKEISKLKDFDDLDDNEQIVINVNNAISNAYLNDLDQHIMLLGDKTKNIDELGDDICDYIENAVSLMSAADKKYAKQQFLQHIPCTFSNSELLSYAKYSLDGAKDRQRLLVGCADIFEIADKAEEEHHHEHHHHDDHCDCTHHHHDDHCDCGHHH